MIRYFYSFTFIEESFHSSYFVVLTPCPLNPGSILRVKSSWPFHLIISEISLEFLAIGKIQYTTPIFGVIDEFALVLNPILFQAVKVSIIETLRQWFRVLVVDDSPPTKLIMLPLTLIGELI